MISLIVVLLLTFSFKVLEAVFRKTGSVIGKAGRYVVYVWGVIAIISSFFVQDHYIFNLPVHYEKVWPAALIIVIANLWISKYSGYQPEGKFNQINFIVAYPVIEEIIFRGLIIPILNQSLLYTTSFEVLYLPVSVPIVISAVLFAIAHLQYYKLNQSSIRYMLFAFAGGVVFGAVTDLTQSILIAVMLHIQFNMMSVCYSISGRKDRNGKQL